MANYVAELMHQLRRAGSSTESARLRRACAKEILDLWEHRAAIPHPVHPLRSLDDVLHAVLAISADRTPWERPPKLSNEWLELAYSVSRASQKLVQIFLRMGINTAALRKAKGAAKDLSKYMSSAELKIIKMLGGLSDVDFIAEYAVEVVRDASGSIKTRKLSASERVEKLVKDLEAEFTKILKSIQSLRHGTR